MDMGIQTRIKCLDKKRIDEIRSFAYSVRVKRRDPSSPHFSEQSHATEPPRKTGARKPDLPGSLARWTGYTLAWVTDIAGQLYTRSMAAIGLQPQQVAVLQLLSEEGAMNQNRLASRTRIDRSLLVGLLNTLETQKLVERRPHPHDRRAFEVHLTEAGRAKLLEIEQVNANVTAQFFAPLAPEERQMLHDLLTRLATSHSLLPEGDADDQP
ncbi:MarR family winged helix-turn-helix transcriptional regulator [Deinococcus sp.]|uniref:MarR family winged helix-turn-helix transcriptional regulator n=1 Tax=Deinococcus sp. TaxID=47478 RepID=UPI003CC50A31